MLFTASKESINRRHSFSSLKGSSSLHPNSSNHNLYINSFAQVMIGPRRPKGSKILAIVDKTILLVNEVGLCCSILNRKQSNLGFQIIPRALVSSDWKLSRVNFHTTYEDASLRSLTFLLIDAAIRLPLLYSWIPIVCHSCSSHSAPQEMLKENY
ncbi:hypothetical protein TNCV_119771 [Trichonephila clavipes]|nr:hypothetical protein TNCV_119771 [Trichonephila clavipes]